MPSNVERKLAAIMFTDIAGYTALSAKDEKKALKLLDIQTENIYPIIEAFDGTINKTVGDGLLITFPTVTSALECDIKVQAASKRFPDLNIRIGNVILFDLNFNFISDRGFKIRSIGLLLKDLSPIKFALIP